MHGKCSSDQLNNYKCTCDKRKNCDICQQEWSGENCDICDKESSWFGWGKNSRNCDMCAKGWSGKIANLIVNLIQMEGYLRLQFIKKV